MYLLYSIVTRVVFVLASPYFLYQALRAQQVRRQHRATARLSPGVVQSGWRRVDLGARRVGGRGAQPRARCLRAACTLSAAAPVPVDDHADRAAARAPQRARRRRASSTSVRLDVHRAPDAECRQAAAVRDGRNGDLAEPAARMPAARHQDGDGQRPHLVPFVPRYRMVRPFIKRVLADIDRFCVQGDETARRLVELGADPARIAVTGSLKFDSLEASPTPEARPRARAALLPHRAQPPGDHRRQHAERRGGAGDPRLQPRAGPPAPTRC